VTDTAGLFPSTFTYEAWVRLDSLLDNREILIAENVGYKLFYLRTYAGSLECVLGLGNGYATAGAALSTIPTLTATTWHHIACTRTGAGRLDLWLDGVPVANATSAYVPPADGTTLSLGGDYRSPPLAPWVGAIDEVRVSDRAVYSGAFTPSRRLPVQTGTVALWHFDEGTGTQVGNAANPAHGVAVLDQGRWVLEGTTSCAWQPLAYYDLASKPAVATTSQCGIGNQGVATVAGRLAWRQTSDCNSLVVPMSQLGSTDMFAVSVDLYLEPGNSPRGPCLYVFNTASPGSAGSHGIATCYRIDDPAGTHSHEWWTASGTNWAVKVQPSAVPDPTASWHTLRIEGSRANCTAKALLDGDFVDEWNGPCDFAGASLNLASWASASAPANVSWANLRLFGGVEGCGP
jgi:hypothetical protein